MRGTTEIEIGGKSRTVKFGTNQSAKYCEIRGLTLEESRSQFRNLFIFSKDGKELIGSNETGGEIRDLIFSGLWAGAITGSEKVDFNQYTVGEWIDEMDQSVLNQIFSTLINSNDGGDIEGGGSDKPEKK